MKTFSSSILSVNESAPIKKQTPITLKNIKENQSDLVRLLEFNDEIAKADVAFTRDYYINLLKLATDESKSYDPVYAAIFNQYDAVSNCVKSMLSASCQADAAVPCTNQDSFHKLLDTFSKNGQGSNDSISIVGFSKTPVNADSTVALQPVRDYCMKIISAIEAGNIESVESIDMVEAVCSHMSKCNGIGEAHSVEQYLSNYSNSFEHRDIEVMASNIHSMIYTVMETNGNVYMCASDIDGYALCETTISLMKVNSDKFSNPNTIRTIVKNLCDAMATYAILIHKARQINNEKREELAKINTARITSALTYNKSIRESMEIFGEEIDSETMFATLDPSDFNPTMFMDLDLVSNHYYDLVKMEAVKTTMAEEAILLAEGKYDQLYTIQEALGQKLKDGVSKLVEAVKVLINKFVETLMGTFGSEKAYLTKYKNIILNNTMTGKMTFYGDVIGGMDKLKQPCKIPTINYSELSADFFSGDDPERNFYNKAFSSLASKVKWEADKNLGDILKVYWGFKDDNAKPITIDFAQIKIADIYNFLITTDKEARTLKIEAKNIERSYQNYVRSAKNNAAQAPAEQANTQQTEKTESYYSVIFDRIMEAKYTPGENDVPKDASNQGSSEQNAEARTNTKMTRGDTDEQVKKSGQAEQQIVRNMEIYCKVCKQVLAARATAFQYVHKELMDVVRTIVKAKLGDSADLKTTSQEGQTQQTQTQEQPAQTAQQPAAAPAKKGFFRRK